MLYIYTDKIKYSTVGASFNVTFSVAPDEVDYLHKLHETFKAMNWSGFPLTAHGTDYKGALDYVTQTEPSFVAITNSERIAEQTEPQTERGESDE